MTNSSPLQLNALGWSYIGFAILWTAGTIATMGFLWHRRRLPHLQMRRLPLVFAAITMLHVYAVLCYVAFMIGYLFPCVVEFWDMNLLLPLGIAIFQIANSQFLHIATRQKRYSDRNSPSEFLRDPKTSAQDRRNGTSLWRRTLRWLNTKNEITRMVIYVSVGITVQIALSLVIFLVSEKFHRGWGLLPDDFLGTNSETRLNCARGWEWWLSIFWQIFWVWIYAPYILFKSRKIEDTHGWRVQTVCCIVAGLPASPLWLCALYVHRFAPVNAVWIAPQWFALSIFFIELFTLGIPCYYVRKQHKLKADTLAIINGWEDRNKFGGEHSIDSGSTKITQHQDLYNACNNSEKGLVCTESRSSKLNKRDNASIGSRQSHMYTMMALEHALKHNVVPLQKFAALKDFSGENISFLTGVSSWKQGWPKPGPVSSRGTTNRRVQFNRAVQIYAAFVSAEHAEFPINISSASLKKLDNLFADAAESLLGDTSSQSTFNSATPFDTPFDNDAGIDRAQRWELKDVSSPRGYSCRADDDAYKGDISSQFGQGVFDEVESEIKYLVLTNTWPKFVNAGYVGTTGHKSARNLGWYFRCLVPGAGGGDR